MRFQDLKINTLSSHPLVEPFGIYFTSHLHPDMVRLMTCLSSLSLEENERTQDTS